MTETARFAQALLGGLERGGGVVGFGWALRANANLSSVRDHVARASSTTSGLGLGARLGGRARLIGEVLGIDCSHRPGNKLDLLWRIRPKHLHLDAVHGEALVGERGR